MALRVVLALIAALAGAPLGAGPALRDGPARAETGLASSAQRGEQAMAARSTSAHRQTGAPLRQDGPPVDDFALTFGPGRPVLGATQDLRHGARDLWVDRRAARAGGIRAPPVCA